MQTSAAANLQLADGVEPVHLAVYDHYMAHAGGYGDPSFSVTIPNFGEGPIESALQETEPNLKLLGLLNVQYLASAFPMAWPGLIPETEIDGTFIYKNEYALPRTWVAHQVVPAEADWLAQLEHLPEKQRQAVTLRIFEGLSFREIGALIGSSEGAARVNYHHGIRRLREMME